MEKPRMETFSVGQEKTESSKIALGPVEGIQLEPSRFANSAMDESFVNRNGHSEATFPNKRQHRRLPDYSHRKSNYVVGRHYGRVPHLRHFRRLYHDKADHYGN